jgi:hypothetical protein
MRLGKDKHEDVLFLVEPVQAESWNGQQEKQLERSRRLRYCGVMMFCDSKPLITAKISKIISKPGKMQPIARQLFIEQCMLCFVFEACSNRFC